MVSINKLVAASVTMVIGGFCLARNYLRGRKVTVAEPQESSFLKGPAFLFKQIWSSLTSWTSFSESKSDLKDKKVAPRSENMASLTSISIQTPNTQPSLVVKLPRRNGLNQSLASVNPQLKKNHTTEIQQVVTWEDNSITVAIHSPNEEYRGPLNFVIRAEEVPKGALQPRKVIQLQTFSDGTFALCFGRMKFTFDSSGRSHLLSVAPTNRR